MWLTPAERRGALTLVAILVVGTLWDLWRSSRWGAPHQASGHFAAAADSSSPPSFIPPHNSHLRDSTRVALDLNHATAAALDGLPGIGPVLAGRIVERRRRDGPYRRLEDLLEVPGIGPRLFDRLRPLVTVSRDTSLTDGMQSAKRRALRRADSPSARDSAFR